MPGGERSGSELHRASSQSSTITTLNRRTNFNSLTYSKACDDAVFATVHCQAQVARQLGTAVLRLLEVCDVALWFRACR